MNPEGAVAVVVGGAGGIGAEVARSLAATYAVCIVDRDPDRLTVVAADVGAALTIAADVGDPVACARMIDDVQTSLGEIAVLVLTAGLSSFGDVPTGDVERWREVLSVNTLSVMYACRAVLPGMIARQVGHIVVVASASGRITYVGEPAYVASKHATVAFCDCLRQELVGTGVRVSLIEPGLVDTPMVQAHPFFQQMLESVAPMPPSEVAAVIEFVVSQPANVCINEIVVRPTGQLL